jgi:hypothetical protein
MTASAPAMSSAARTGNPGEVAEASAAGPAPGSGVREPVCGAGLGVAVGLTPGGRPAVLAAPVRVLAVLSGAASGAGVMTGNRAAAFPAGTTMVMTRLISAAGIAADGGTAGNRPAALPPLMIIPVLLVTAGIGSGGSAEPGRDPPAAPAERAGEPPADGTRDAGRAGLALDKGDRVGLALRVGDGDTERVSLALADGDAGWVALALADGDAG